MHALLTLSTARRGAIWVAGMLARKTTVAPTPKHAVATALTLVSWLSETHSRRADEDARRAQLDGSPPNPAARPAISAPARSMAAAPSAARGPRAASP